MEVACIKKISAQLNQDLLLIPELQRVFIHNKHYYKLEIANESYGTLSSTQRNETSAAASEYSESNTNALLYTTVFWYSEMIVYRYTMSLYKEQTQIYYFDPHSRDRNGNVSPQGTAVLMYFVLTKTGELYNTHRQIIALWIVWGGICFQFVLSIEMNIPNNTTSIARHKGVPVTQS